MLWLLVLHIVGVVSWCGMLLYLLALIAASVPGGESIPIPGEPISLARRLFIVAATPAGLFAVVTGTSLFLLGAAVGPWLIAKLTAVAGLVVCHALSGALILHLERVPQTRAVPLCSALATVSIVLMATILWLVLSKPVWRIG